MKKICEFENCKNHAYYGLYYSRPLRCKEHKEDYKLQSNICVCGTTQPHFNFEGETKAMYCNKCKLIDMVDIKHPMCKCGKKRPCFNHIGETKPICCNDCKESNMVNVKDKICEYCGLQQASFNYEGETKPISCAKCKLDGMVNIKSKKCKCKKKAVPVYNYEGKTVGLCCKSCKKDGMVDVRHIKCKCSKARASYNFEGETEAICCNSCKESGMIDIKHKICLCDTAIPNFNYEGETNAICCSKCKQNGMINIKIDLCRCKRCEPTFNYEGQKNAICCASCREPGMINIKSKWYICKGPNCPSGGNIKYKGYCTNCFSHLFPNDPLTFQIRCKTKEIAVRDFVNLNYEGFVHDKPLWVQGCDCTHKRRIDHRKLIGNTLLCVETDEHQHMSYSKEDEINRYHDCYMALSGKMIFIRFNPDKYMGKDGSRKNPKISTRLAKLKKEIDKQIERIENEENKDLLEVIKLYYDQEK